MVAPGLSQEPAQAAAHAFGASLPLNTGSIAQSAQGPYAPKIQTVVRIGRGIEVSLENPIPNDISSAVVMSHYADFNLSGGCFSNAYMAYLRLYDCQ